MNVVSSISNWRGLQQNFPCQLNMTDVAVVATQLPGKNNWHGSQCVKVGFLPYALFSWYNMAIANERRVAKPVSHGNELPISSLPSPEEPESEEPSTEHEATGR